MTIAEIQELDNEAKVPPFTVRLDFVNDPRGKVQTCKASDETGSIKLTLISRPPVSKALQGKTLTVVGGIFSMDNYTGTPTPQVKLLPKGSFDIQGAVSPEEKRSEPQPSKVNGNTPGHYNGNGQRVGMCVKAAIDILIAGYHKGDYSLEFFGSPEFGPALKRIASDVCRVSEDLEAHKLAPAAKEREALTAGQDKVIQAAQELFTGEQG